MAGIPSSRAAVTNDDGTLAPAWYRFLSNSTPPEGALVLWPSNVTYPKGYIYIGELSMTNPTVLYSIHVLIRGNAPMLPL